jgi:hypothetical protein
VLAVVTNLVSVYICDIGTDAAALLLIEAEYIGVVYKDMSGMVIVTDHKQYRMNFENIRIIIHCPGNVAMPNVITFA